MKGTGDDQGNQARVDELIDRGLERYGAGEHEAALADWKHAQALAPTCDRVREYILLVESHYNISEDRPGEESPVDEEHAAPAPLGGWELDDDWGETSGDVGLAFAEDSRAQTEEMPGNGEDEPPSMVLRELGLRDGQDQSDRSILRNSELENVVSGEIVVGTTVSKSTSEQECRDVSGIYLADDDIAKSPVESIDDLELSPFLGQDQGGAGSNYSEDLYSSQTTATVVRHFHDPAFSMDIADDPEEGNDEMMELASFTHTLEVRDNQETENPLGEAPGTSIGLSFDDELTSLQGSPALQASQQFHSEQTSEILPPGHPRLPTANPEISRLEVNVDDGMLSFEDATHELDLGTIEAQALQRAGRANPIIAEGDGNDGELDLGIPSEEISEIDVGETPTAATSDEILAEITAQAPTGNASERADFIVRMLIKRAIESSENGQPRLGASAALHALEYADDNAIAQKLVVGSERQLIRALVSGIGDLSEVPRLVVPLVDIPFDEINHRAAFLLTRMDGTLTLEEILDVSGMPRIEALRHLSRLHVRGYLVVE